MAAPKVRIYELSKELGMTNQELMDLLEKKFNITVKSHASSIEAEVADKVRALKSGSQAESSSVSQASEPASKVEAPKIEPKVERPSVDPKKTEPPASEPVVHRMEPRANREPQRHQAPVRPQQPAAQTQAPQVDKRPQSSPSVGNVGGRPSGQPMVASSPQKTQAQVAIQDAPSRPQSEAQRQQQGKPTQPSQQQRKEQPRPQQQAHPAAVASSKVKQEPVVEEPQVIKIEAPLSIAELAQKLKKRETELIRHLFMKGVMVTVNQTMQVEDAMNLAKELGFEVEGPSDKPEVDFAAPELKVRQAKGKHLRHRAPVVSIMGHVDHGKTSLLDAIRASRHRIVDTEAGGITQSIGAYTVMQGEQKIVFIDTPGHEAFTAMRMRGAQATDIAILVVAADDGVMPQTIEAINHAKAANIPIIVAVNKIDKADADPDRVMVQLSEHGLMAEKWGGDTIMVEVSALQKLGLDDLLEMITLVAELQELKADSTVPAEGVVIEAKLDKGKGPVATVLVQNGTLHVGENIVMGRIGGRIRALISDTGERLKSAGPSTPVEILGLNEVPLAGEAFEVVRNDKEFKRLLQERQNQDREQRLNKMIAAPGLMSDKETERKDFYVIVKAETQGSVEAISASLLQLATEEVSVHVLHGGTGDVSEADVLLASASNALIIAFNIKAETNALRVAQDRGIQIREYDIIYNVLEDMEKMMLGLLSPETEEQETGCAEVRQLFSFGKTIIAGCYVTEGKIVRNGVSRVFRNGKEIFKGTLSNLKRFKEDAREVASGYECGISFDKFNDLQPGDIIRLYTIKETERTSL